MIWSILKLTVYDSHKGILLQGVLVYAEGNWFRHIVIINACFVGPDDLEIAHVIFSVAYNITTSIAVGVLHTIRDALVCKIGHTWGTLNAQYIYIYIYIYIYVYHI